MTEKFSQVMEQLSKEYDIILIDSPPVLAVTDASIIGRYASTVLMIVRFESCSLKSVAAAANRFNVNVLILPAWSSMPSNLRRPTAMVAMVTTVTSTPMPTTMKA